MPRFSKTMTAIEYFTESVRRYRTYGYNGPASLPIVRNCYRGILAREAARWPELAGKAFQFDMDPERGLINPRFVPAAQATATQSQD